MSNLNNERVIRQEEINDMIKLRGESTHEQNSLRLAKDQGYGETASGKRFINQTLKGFVEKFNEYVDRQLLLPTNRSVIIKHLVVKNDECVEYRIDPIQMGRIVVRSLLRSLVRPTDRRITVTRVGFDIGESIENFLKESMLDEYHAKAKSKLMDMLRRQGKLGDKDVITKELNALSKRIDLDHNDWSAKDHGSIGVALLTLFYKSNVYGVTEIDNENLVFGDIFVEHDENYIVGGQRRTKKVVDISDTGSDWIQGNYNLISSLTLSFLPMVIEPQDWTIDHGGYYDQGIYDTYPLIKGYSRKKIKKLYEQYPQGFNTLMDTINILQKTPFRVNETIWNAVNYVHKNEHNLNRKGIPTYEKSWEKFIGADKAQEFFDTKRMLTRKDNRLTEESKTLLLRFIRSVIKGSSLMSDQIVWKEWATLRKSVISHSRSEVSKRILIENTLTDSSEFIDEDIYFCYNADYRGRIYPLAGQFSPQGSDTSRGMLEFADGVTVDPEDDEDAIRQIAIVIANNFGEDKISLDDREFWCHANTTAILECADDFENNRWWMEADKPFLFLLGCLEWKKFVDAKENGKTFVSTLPIGFDGSCNGIQHYSALFLDETGAGAVNLVDGEVPSDVYQEVADQALFSS